MIPAIEYKKEKFKIELLHKILELTDDIEKRLFFLLKVRAKRDFRHMWT